LQKKVNNDKYFDKRNTILGKVEMPVAHNELFFPEMRNAHHEFLARKHEAHHFFVQILLITLHGDHQRLGQLAGAGLF
jgi:hypothetical protein